MRTKSFGSWLLAGALMGGFSVALGAFGAHSLKESFEPSAMQTWQTACRYLMYQGLAVGLTSLFIMQRPDDKHLQWSARCLFWGSLLFSGSLFILAVTQIKPLGIITPVGGMIQITGWGLLAYTGWQNR